MPELAKIEREEDLRKAWPKGEASDFTPWLAENIEQLGEALGVQLALVETEASVGRFSLDILAIDLEENGIVIIENQLEPTDHAHLGQLLTYAGGFDANLVVWLTAEFKEEHRQALDWLNQRTDEHAQFFGVVVELWKIDGSRLAPHFKVVSAPNNWRKQSVRNVLGRSERSERYATFFQPLIDTVREKHEFYGTRTANGRSYCGFASGYPRIGYAAEFTIDKQARVELYIDVGDGDRNSELLERLEEYKEQIESDVAEPLDWQRLEGKRACRIAVVRDGSIDNDDDTLAEIRDWMVDRLLKFRKVLDPHLKELVKR